MRLRHDYDDTVRVRVRRFVHASKRREYDVVLVAEGYAEEVFLASYTLRSEADEHARMLRHALRFDAPAALAAKRAFVRTSGGCA